MRSKSTVSEFGPSLPPVNRRQEEKIFRILRFCGPFPTAQKARTHKRVCKVLCDRLVLSLTRAAIKIAKAYAQWSDLPDPIHDLVQQARIGIYAAIKWFDPNNPKRLQFKWYAYTHMLKEVRKDIRRRGIKYDRRWFDVGPKIRKFINQFKDEHNRQPSQSEISNALNIPEDTLSDIQQALLPMFSLSHRALTDSPHEGEYDFLEIPDNTSENASENERKQMLRDEISHLPERDRLIITMLYLNPHGPTTQSSIARELGVTRERIRQVESRVLSQLRVRLQKRLAIA